MMGSNPKPRFKEEQMAFQPGFVQIHVEVRPSPGAFLAADPTNLVVDQGDVAQTLLTVTPLNGFAGPIYLRAKNYASSDKIFSVNPIPAGGGQSTASFNLGVAGVYDIGIEALDKLPDGEAIQ